MARHPASFRDPASGVILAGNSVYRYFTGDGREDFAALVDSGLLPSLVQRGWVIDAVQADGPASVFPHHIPEAAVLVEHPRLPFISYPYEWPFEMLRDAAILQLDVLLASLEAGLSLKDATPYNVQFQGAKPLFIDLGSFQRYQEGAPWAGYSQFCRLFLNPLLLTSLTGVPFQPWLRGSLEGIEPELLSRVLPFRRKLRKDVFIDVVLQSWFNRRASRSRAPARLRPIPKAVLQGLANRLKKSISGLVRRNRATAWTEYETHCPYGPEAQEAKDRFVEKALARARPHLVWDLGCNLGRYSMMAARHADCVVAIDNDEAVIGALYDRIKDTHANLLPLVVDLLNPSPSLGWAHQERDSLADRGPADFALCLALVHHLAIGGNVPLPRLVDWLAQVARAAVVEFVPKQDPMVQLLLRSRRDVFQDYSEGAFQKALLERFHVDETLALPGSGRTLYTIGRREERHA